MFLASLSYKLHASCKFPLVFSWCLIVETNEPYKKPFNYRGKIIFREIMKTFLRLQQNCCLELKLNSSRCLIINAKKENKKILTYDFLQKVTFIFSFILFFLEQ